MATVRLSNYSLDRYGYPDLNDVLEDYGFKNVVLIGGQRALDATYKLIEDELKNTDKNILGKFVYGKDSTMTNVKLLMKKDEVQKADVIFAIGGGKAIDTCKVLGVELNKKVFSFPTICSNCSAATAIAVLYNDDGSFSHYDARMKAPYHVFICTDVIANAPEIYMWAGVGDGISKEAEVVYATRGLNLDTTASLGLAIAKSCEKPFLKYGKQAIEDTKNNIASEAVEKVALDVLISTGYVSNLTNQKDYYYNSSLAHAFYNGSTHIKREGNFEHGEVVAFGVMVLYAYDNDLENLQKIANFNKSVKLPITLEELNLDYKCLDKLVDSATNTTEWKSSKTEFSIDKFKEAIIKADKFGKSLKN